jgi:hypothetical protein
MQDVAFYFGSNAGINISDSSWRMLYLAGRALPLVTQYIDFYCENLR